SRGNTAGARGTRSATSSSWKSFPARPRRAGSRAPWTNSSPPGRSTSFAAGGKKRGGQPPPPRRRPGASRPPDPPAGCDSAALMTRAVRNGNEYVLNGAKTFVTNGQYADLFLLMARTSQESKHRGITAFLVERGAPGLKIGKAIEKMGIRGSDTVEL